jgi:hypothetical protein
MNVSETLNNDIAEELYQQGWSVQAHYFEPAFVQPLAAEATQRHEAKKCSQQA